jgi:hypothetical protein
MIENSPALENLTKYQVEGQVEFGLGCLTIYAESKQDLISISNYLRLVDQSIFEPATFMLIHSIL